MKIKLTILALCCVLIMPQSVYSDDMSELKAQLAAMQQQMQAMQAKLEAQEIALQKQQQATQQISHQQAAKGIDKQAKGVLHEVADSISLSGVVEVVANQTDSDGWSDERASDLVLDTFELAIDASAGDWTSAHVLFLYEDADDDNLNVDEAFITFANPEVTPFYVTAGRLYVPFGNFESYMISDPATLTLAETREEVVQLGFETDSGFYGSAYVFNGDADEAKNAYSALDNNTIDNYGLNIGYAMEKDDFSLDIGAGYINNIATSDNLQDLVDNNTLCAGDGCIKDYVAGFSVHAIANYKQFSLIGEYVTALDDFKAGELSEFNTTDELKPRAWNIEGAYHFDLAGKDSTFALAYQKTRDMYFDVETTDYFEKAWLASISVGIIDNTTLSAEWKHSDGYSEVKNQRRNNGDKFSDEDLMQVKLSYEF